MENKKHPTYFYGPVPSRRLGRSFGVDIVPFKICTLDCIYCQLGKTTKKTIERKIYVPAEPIIAELQESISNGLSTDYITIAGSGEPTLNSQLGGIISQIKKICDIPVAVLTNGTLFYMPEVRADCIEADVVLPSLDAGDELTFRRINRPHTDISIEKHISGLVEFRKEFNGQIWLEVFLVEPVNTNDEQIAKIRTAIKRISPDKVQLNTAVRPTADAGINRINSGKLQMIADALDSKCEIIADISDNSTGTDAIEHLRADVKLRSEISQRSQTLLSMLKRRPCSLEDISTAMGISRNEAVKYVTDLLSRGNICSQRRGERIFYQASK